MSDLVVALFAVALIVGGFVAFTVGLMGYVNSQDPRRGKL